MDAALSGPRQSESRGLTGGGEGAWQCWKVANIGRMQENEGERN